MLWGLTLYPGNVVKETVDYDVHLSMAALETRQEFASSSSDGQAQVVLQTERGQFVVCTLVYGSIPQQPLDMEIKAGEMVTLFSHGKGVIHLTGNASSLPLESPEQRGHAPENLGEGVIHLTSNASSVPSESPKQRGHAPEKHGEGTSKATDEPGEKAVAAPTPRKCKKRPVSKTSTVRSWGLDWLETCQEEVDSGLGALQFHCIACRRYRPKTSKNNRGAVSTDPFISGTLNVKKFSAVRHGESEAHKVAYELWKNDAPTEVPTVQALAKVDEQAFGKMVKLFDIAYHLAKNELPFTHFTSLANLDKRHGVDLGSTHLDPTQARTFTEFLAEDIRLGLGSAIRKARYVSILIDGCTDRSTLEKALLYIKYFEAGVPHTRFIGIHDVDNANADSVLGALDGIFVQHSMPDWKDNLVGVCADGASMNFGWRERAIAELRNQVPWLMGIHCVAHRLELAVKEAYEDTYFTKEIDSFLSSYAAFYRGSPKQVRELSYMAEILNESVLRPTPANDTRWVDHKRRALEALELNYAAVAAHLTELGSEQAGQIGVNDAAEAREMSKKMSSYRFILHMALYTDILNELAQVSVSLRRDDVCLAEVIEAVENAHGVLSDMYGKDGATLQLVKRQCSGGNYRGLALTGLVTEHAEFETVSRPDNITHLVNCLEDRLFSLRDHEVFSAVTSLNPRTWPEDLRDLEADDDVRVLLDHFADILVAHGCDPVAALAEWFRLKEVLRENPGVSGMTWSELWGPLSLSQRKDFPNFFHVMEIVQVLPLPTAVVERGFSLVDRVKRDWRGSLATKTVEDLMTIVLEGPPEEAHDCGPSVTRWFKAGKQSRRPLVEPCGPGVVDTEHGM